MKKPNLQSLENIDSFINIDFYNKIEKINSLNEKESIENKLRFIYLYADAVYSNKPRNTKKFEKYVSKLTIECISLFMKLTSMAIQIHNRKEVLEKAKIGGDFIINIIKDTEINKYNNNGKIFTKGVGKNKKTLIKSDLNQNTTYLQNYENLLKRLKSF